MEILAINMATPSEKAIVPLELIARLPASKRAENVTHLVTFFKPGDQWSQALAEMEATEEWTPSQIKAWARAWASTGAPAVRCELTARLARLALLRR